MSAIKLNDDLIHYEVLGRGRAVVLVHGWVGSWRYWIPTMQQLHLKFRVYAVDLFGFGDSAKAERLYNLDQQVALLQEFMSQLTISKAAFIGHGLGALLLTEYARRYHASVARLMLINAPLFDPGDLATRTPPPDILVQPDGSARAPSTPNGDATLPSRPPAMTAHHDETIINSRLIDRARLREEAQAKAERELGASLLPAERPVHHIPTTDTSNPLYQRVGRSEPEALLSRCFKKSESHYSKLLQDVNKTDPAVLSRTTERYNPGRTLDIIRSLPMPVVMVQGTEDPLYKPPTEAIWDYLDEKETPLVQHDMPGVRHFPMLENNLFFQVLGHFLEQQKLGAEIVTKERWRRPHR